MSDNTLQTLAINTIRTLSMDAIQQANSGHPGLPMGAAPMAYALWMEHMHHHPQAPDWFNRDRFVLSAGHGSMLLYALLHLTGYDLSLDELKAFRQWGSRTPGHPEVGHTAGVEMTTGPLGQGISTAVGMALAERFLADKFNTEAHAIVDHYTYVLAGDGDLMEGVTTEACSLAGHWGLGKLIVLYDANDITLDGAANMTFSEDVRGRFEAQGWHVLDVADGDSADAVSAAITEAKAATARPTLIIAKTTIGYGSPNKAGTSKAHGSPLGAEEIALTKAALNWPSEEPFFVPDDALAHFRTAIDKGAAAQSAWDELFAAWAAANPELAEQFDDALNGRLHADWYDDLPVYDTDSKPIATRSAGGEALNAIAKYVPTMIGGDADLAGSTKTLISGEAHTGAGNPAARNIRFGVREHAMGAIVNGLALHGAIVKPYSATFLTFSDYMRGAIRLGALMNVGAVYVFTHDSIGLGEDGPTHQPVEQVMSLRMIPNLTVFRPADPNETAEAWRNTMLIEGPVAMILTRQNLPPLPHTRVAEGVARGGYVLADSAAQTGANAEVILLASGSEVHIALEAHEALNVLGITSRVVSMPSWELFDAQEEVYKQGVLPPSITARVSIEAGVTLGWQKYVGTAGIAIGVDTFGASAPYQRIYEEYGLTQETVVEAARSLVR